MTTEQEFEEFIDPPSFGWNVCWQCGQGYIPDPDNPHKCHPSKRKYAPTPKGVKTVSQTKNFPGVGIDLKEFLKLCCMQLGYEWKGYFDSIVDYIEKQGD